MIEDDLRGLLDDAMDVDVYSRLIPLDLPECVTVQEIGGDHVDAGIRRTSHTITVMAVSSVQATAIQRMKFARNYLIRNIPATIGATHYYTAVPMADGSLKMKALNGPRYVEYVDMQVVASI
jgi:hypothetical protein